MQRRLLKETANQSPKNSFSCYEFYDMIKFRFQANDLVGMAMPLKFG